MVTYSLEQVETHNNESDCWMVIRGKVYDVTNYLKEHPGGVEIMTDLAGEDATEDYEDVGHSEEADEALLALCIGEVGAPNPNASATTTPVKQAPPPAAATAPKPTAKPVAPRPVSSKPSQQSPPPAAEEDNTMMIAIGVVVVAAVGFLAMKKLT